MIKHIYFLNIQLETGGPENIHQVCNALASNGYDASILYLNGATTHPARFQAYGNKITQAIVPGDESLFIFPEFLEASKFKDFPCKKALWWLSLDNSPDLKQKNLKQYLADSKIDICFSQCQYAYDYLASWNISNVFNLPDYINDKYFQPLHASAREPNVLFNPKKGIEFTSKIIQQNPDIKFIPIQGMNVDQVIELMDKSMVYIDFGTHPGKDRIPREAAMRNLIVITNKNGAAQNDIDVPIPHEFKFDSNLGVLKQIGDKLRQCISCYNDEIAKFDSYREKIKAERSDFVKNTLDTFSAVCNI